MKRRLKVLQVIGSLRIGGAENVAMNILRYIDKNKYQCDFLVFEDCTGGYEEEAKSLGARIIKIPLPSEGYVSYYKNLKKVFLEEKYDIVHSHVLLNSGLVLLAAYSTNIKKRLVHSHSTQSGRPIDMKYKFYEVIMKSIIRKYSTTYISCGIEAADYLYGHKRFIRNNGVIINNGIDLDKFKPNIDTRNRVREELNVNNKLVIGHVGRIAEVKNHSFLLDIFSVFKKNNPNSVLLIVGDGELRVEIENKIKKLNIINDVIITGTRSDIPDILQAFDVFVFPSFFEGFPVTVVEAQSSGVQCLISDTVSKEVKITNLVNFMSINESAEKWARVVADLANYKRTDYSKEVLEKGFGVRESIKKLEIIYKT